MGVGRDRDRRTPTPRQARGCAGLPRSRYPTTMRRRAFRPSINLRYRKTLSRNGLQAERRRQRRRVGGICGDLAHRPSTALAAANPGASQVERSDYRVRAGLAAGDDPESMHRRVRILVEANAIHRGVVSAASRPRRCSRWAHMVSLPVEHIRMSPTHDTAKSPETACPTNTSAL